MNTFTQFIVICLELNDGGKPYPLPATRRLFNTIEAAQKYAGTIDPSRAASVIDLSQFESRD